MCCSYLMKNAAQVTNEGNWPITLYWRLGLEEVVDLTGKFARGCESFWKPRGFWNKSEFLSRRIVFHFLMVECLKGALSTSLKGSAFSWVGYYSRMCYMLLLPMAFVYDLWCRIFKISIIRMVLFEWIFSWWLAFCCLLKICRCVDAVKYNVILWEYARDLDVWKVQQEVEVGEGCQIWGL